MYIFKVYKVLTCIHTQKATAKLKIMDVYIQHTPSFFLPLQDSCHIPLHHQALGASDLISLPF